MPFFPQRKTLGLLKETGKLWIESIVTPLEKDLKKENGDELAIDKERY